MHPRSRSAGGDEPRVPQMPQVSGHARLGHLENLDDIADTQRTVLQQTQNPQAGTVAECAERPVNVVGRVFVRRLLALRVHRCWHGAVLQGPSGRASVLRYHAR